MRLGGVKRVMGNVREVFEETYVGKRLVEERMEDFQRVEKLLKA